MLGQFSFSGLELSGSQNATYYFFINSQAITTENFGDSRFGMNWTLSENEIMINGTYYYMIPIYLRHCIEGEVFENKGNKYILSL